MNRNGGGAPTDVLSAAGNRAMADRARQPIVDILARRGTPTTVAYLAAQTGRSRSAVRRALRHLIDADTVAVTTDPFDRRIPRYHLTEGA